MKNEINAVLENMTATTPEQEDYTGEDGLLYCGKCRKPKEAYFPEGKELFGRDHFLLCIVKASLYVYHIF